MIKDSKLFIYIDSDFENWNVVDSHPQVEKRTLNITDLMKDSTFAQIFTDPENQWVTQEEVLDFCTNRKDELHKDWASNFFLLKSNDKFFVTRVDFDDDGRLKVNVNELSYDHVWHASIHHRFVVPATKPVILNTPQSLNPSDTSLEQRLEKLETWAQGIGYKI